MTDAVFRFAGDAIPAARALAEGPALAASLEGGGPRVSIYGAGLAGDAVALGRWQRASSTFRGEASRLVRRATGGVACHAGDGIVYLALGLADASALMPCPHDRVLNRNVRGLLSGLSALGIPAYYFGRDFVSVAHRPAAMVAWDRDASGRVLVEAFVARTRRFALDDADDGHAPRAEPPFLGKEPIALAEVWPHELGVEALVRGIATRGYADRFGLVLRDAELPRDVAELGTPSDDTTLRWSPPFPIAIGFVHAGLATRDGVIVDARIAGDFDQDRDAPEKLAARLRGEPATRATIAAALDATYGRAGDAVIEGVRALDDVLRAFDAVL